MTQTEEITEILNRPAGSVITYHVGHLSFDRIPHHEPGMEIKPEERIRASRVDDTGSIAMRLSDFGKVSLVQKRIGANCWAYMAQRTARA